MNLNKAINEEATEEKKSKIDNQQSSTFDFQSKLASESTLIGNTRKCSRYYHLGQNHIALNILIGKLKNKLNFLFRYKHYKN